jgi:thiamine-phosphate pyrophosphorylase
MREQCSPAVLRAIESTSPTATAANLLLALTDEEDGRAAVLLEKHGAARDRLRARLAELSPAIVPSIDQLIADAQALSRECQAEETITSEFFLLALLQANEELHAILEETGLDRAGLERDILGEPAPPLPAIEAIALADTSDRLVIGRILDVNANRARESLRTLDDYCRFDLNDVYLTGEVKRLRHDLARLLDLLPSTLFLGGRETERDVGTAIGAEGEMFRGSPCDAARINAKRLQESFRSMEEFGKVIDCTFAEGIEQLRYRAYTIEKALFLTREARQKLAGVCLYVLLTGSQCEAALDWTIAEAAAGGAGMFQLREKELDDRALLQRARDVRKWTRQNRALFIVNDRPDIARLSDADGVHLGQSDMSVLDARRILGADVLIGVSTHNLDQVRQAVLDGASYIGVGPVFASTTKKLESLAGTELVKSAVAETSLPSFAIGGINSENIGAVVAAGARRVAVSAAIAKANEPRLAALLLVQACRQK